jgi:hypothetical protein
LPVTETFTFAFFFTTATSDSLTVFCGTSFESEQMTRLPVR